jgi:EAL and modified HD-GYP domain-containing signal transduction protein
VTSLRHAVMMLGRKRLFRWATMLLAISRAAGSAPAVASAAMVRGRLTELLAAELLPPSECDNAFVVGLFSLLDVMLDMPMPAALESIALPEEVAHALLQRDGLLAPFLALTKACESGDEAAYAAAAEQLQLSGHQINRAHLQALAWAEELAATW